jgi:hypothetical protein
MLAFYRRTAIQAVYLYLGEEPASAMPPEFQQRLAEFLKECHALRIEVHALQGNPLWALKVNHSLVLTWIKGYLEFNRTRALPERIDGVHLDIEPYLTSEWETGDQEKLKAEFLELLTQCRALIDDEPGDHPFQMGVAIPIFYNREPDFEEALLKVVDYAALMDYYDTAIDLIEQGRFHVELASCLGKKMIIGVETQDLVQMGQGKRRNTLHEEGWEEMERQLKATIDAFAGEAGFGGVAIHAYHSYRVLQKGRNVPTRERPATIPPLTASRLASPVAIDGDLSEWNDTAWVMVNKRDQVVYGVGAWGGPRDLSFKAALQWEPEALLMAVEVTDDAVVQEKRGADMWEGDHMEVWVDADLLSDYNEAVNSPDDFQIGLSPGNFGERMPEVFIWVPSVVPGSLGQIRLAAQRTGQGYTVEIRLPTSFLFQTLGRRAEEESLESAGRPHPFPPPAEEIQRRVLDSKRLEAGFRLGMMIDGSDGDHVQHPQKCLLSTSSERQWGDPTSFNILELK